MRDLKSNLDAVNSVKPTGNRTASVNGASADLQGYDGALIVIPADTITDGTHTPSLEESDDDATFTAVAAGDLEGSFAAITANSIQRVGYKGAKRYIRAVVTVSGATTGGKYCAAILRGYPSQQPLA